MSEEEVGQTIPDSLLRYATHLAPLNDLTLIFLKGHLVIEECLVSILESRVSHPEALDKAGLSFHQKVCIVEALWSIAENKTWIWESLRRINNIRNDLAHKLEPPKLNQKIEDFFRFMKQNVRIEINMNDESEPIESRLRGVFAFLSGVLSRDRA